MYKLILLLLLFPNTFACDDKSILFSDDFETYEIGQIPDAPWKAEGNGKIYIDDKKSKSGKKSVHFITGETYQNRAFLGLFDKTIFPLKENFYYGSMNMWIEEASPDGIHWTMLQSSGKVFEKEFTSEIRYGGQHQKQLMANYETNGVKSDCWQHSNVKIPEKSWFNVIWHFDGNKNLMKIRIDGKLIKEITVKNKGEGCINNDLNGEWIFPIFENVKIGWVDYQSNGGSRNIWIDDFKISTKPIKFK